MQLPPEIRSRIWAMASTGWSYTTFNFEELYIKSVGLIDHWSISQVCYESRELLHTKTILLEGLGRFNFNRHVFFFRNFEDHGVMDLMGRYTDFFSHVQHVVINPEFGRLMKTFSFISNNCPSLQSLVVIVPWFVPPPPDQWFHDWSLWDDAPDTLDDSQAFTRSPTELDLGSLLHGLDPLGADNDANIKGYRSQLKQLVQQAEEDGEVFLPGDICYDILLSLRQLDRLQGIMAESTASPRIYLRDRASLKAPFA